MSRRALSKVSLPPFTPYSPPLSGHWDDNVEFQLKNNDKITCSFHGESARKFLPPQDKQVEMESGRVWAKVVDALRRDDLNAVDSERNVVEQRYNKDEDDE